MSRIPSIAATASLTEELDKLEQSITLTLQEIDHNFSRAHGIVTSSILPIIEKYTEHSNSLWEGSKFWKQFFEASANVSLSGVEEHVKIDEDESSTHRPDNSRQVTGVFSKSDDDFVDSDKEEDSKSREFANDVTNESLLEDADINESTPRLIKPIYQNQEFSSKREPEYMPTTPGYRSHLQANLSHISEPSLLNLKSDLLLMTKERHGVDPLLHRVLDKNYRIQATPLKTLRNNKRSCNKAPMYDTESPMSSPLEAVPQLHTDIFCSPSRPLFKMKRISTPFDGDFTPAKGTLKNVSSSLSLKEEITWESDGSVDPEDVYNELGMSPPKTIQFNLPQTKLLQTPAREASQRIVQDLLATAGVGCDSSDTEDSPSLVTRGEINESF